MSPTEKLDASLNEIGGCGDSSCLVVRPKGMCTNGGCRCGRDSFKMQRVIHAYLQFRKEVE